MINLNVKRIEQAKRDYLLKHYRLPNVLIVGYAIHDELILCGSFAGMRVLLYPEKSFKNEFEVTYIEGVKKS